MLGQGTDTFADFVDGNCEMYGLKIGLVSGVTSTDVYVRPSNMTAGERSWYDGVGFAQAQPIPTLEVNTTTGEVFLKNPFSTAVNLSYYEIRSASGALNPGGWNSLDNQNFDALDGDDSGTVAGDSLLEGWDEAGPVGLSGDFNGNGTVDAADYVVWRKTDGTQAGYDAWRTNFGATGGSEAGSPNILNETNFLRVSSLAANSSKSLGNAFRIGGNQDLTFNFGLVDSGFFSLSVVNYVTSGSSAAAAVPEPSSALLGAFGMVLLITALRRKPARLTGDLSSI